VDSNKFDGLARVFANASSRRTLVRGIAATVLGAGVVTGVGAREAFACVDVGSSQKCKNDNDCCGDDVRCRNQKCKCRSGFRKCRENGKDQCFDLKNDDDHCGSCNKRCRNGESCSSGKCGGNGNCTVRGFCGAGRPPCCAGLACRAGQPNLGLGGCVPA
jgi:hypothetical protein